MYCFMDITWKNLVLQTSQDGIDPSVVKVFVEGHKGLDLDHLGDSVRWECNPKVGKSKYWFESLISMFSLSIMDGCRVWHGVSLWVWWRCVACEVLYIVSFNFISTTTISFYFDNYDSIYWIYYNTLCRFPISDIVVGHQSYSRQSSSWTTRPQRSSTWEDELIEKQQQCSRRCSKCNKKCKWCKHIRWCRLCGCNM